MTREENSKGQLNALNRFVVECNELLELERKIGKFNLYRVLGIEHTEIRHSNTLAWLFNPAESHGIGDSFLRTWLKRIRNDCDLGNNEFPSQVEVHTSEFISVDVRREWKNIDLIILIETKDQGKWLVLIENKIESVQGKNQLENYEKTAKKHFPDCKYQINLFLTKYGEKPNTDHFVSTSYEIVHDVLEDMIARKKDTIGAEPLVLLKHYKDILEENNMPESEVAKLAKSIYKKHRDALDIIYEHRPDELVELPDLINENLSSSKSNMGIQIKHKQKCYVRFIPNQWDKPINLRGDAWGKNNSAFVLFELDLWGSFPKLKVLLGKPPKEWAEKLWEIAKKPPFNPGRKIKMPEQCICIHLVESSFSMKEINESNIEGCAQQIIDWIKKNLDEVSTKEIVRIVESHLPMLESYISPIE